MVVESQPENEPGRSGISGLAADAAGDFDAGLLSDLTAVRESGLGGRAILVGICAARDAGEAAAIRAAHRKAGARNIGFGRENLHIFLSFSLYRVGEKCQSQANMQAIPIPADVIPSSLMV
jgi:hypothetical protein